ncbi:MAG: leucyl/phenylalanyl-tRNA--protein transferase [Alphaproteobacteria bacterium]|nr:leucyl/phenylalanyl-tRNA--protein transferase [Alphaproteobacteria bacterium]
MSRVFGPNELLDCYRRGVFPMADSADDPRLFLVDPDQRGVLPLDGFHLSRKLRKTVLANRFTVRVDTAFAQVMDCCAEPAPGRINTWINAPIHNLYGALHRMGYAHSVECWEGDDLVGGLYGVHVRGAFFGESMFSRRTDASKVALVHLVGRLLHGGFRLLDTQFITQHLRQFGAVEIDRDEFQRRLADAMSVEASFGSEAYWLDGTDGSGSGTPTGASAGADAGAAGGSTDPPAGGGAEAAVQLITQTS